MKKNIILLGSGGHAKSCIDVIETNKLFKIAGLIGKTGKTEKIYNYRIIGTDSQLQKIKRNFSNVLIAVGQIKSAEKRVKLFEKAKKLGFKFPTIISPRAYVSRRAKIGAGSIIMHGVVINANAVVGKNCIINTKSIIEHDVIVGDHCHVSTGAILNGSVLLGKKSFVGSGSVIKDGVKIGSNCVVGANTFLRKNLSNNKIFKK